MTTEHELSLIITTTGNKKQARDLSNTLVNKKLSACVQITEIESIYPWQGEIEEEKEYRLMIKAVKEREEQTVQYIKDHHPYDTPEILISNFRSDKDYFDWCLKVSDIQ